MKKLLTLLAVATLPAAFSGCAACSPGLSLCPCCPCNWCNRAPACPPAPAPVCCPPTTYATPVAACPPACPPVASQMMPQYIMPGAMPLAAAGPQMCNPCQAQAMPQPMYYQQPQQMYYEPSCGYNMMMEPGCGTPSMVSYGPMEGCSSGCCEGGPLTAPAPEAYIAPEPGA
jgi:hypothetical protein